MKYEIKGDNLPVVICNLEPGEAMTNQGGSMSWMSDNMNMTTEGGGSLGKAIGRLFSGEKIFRNVFTCNNKPGMVAFAASFPGHIVAFEITPEKPIIIQKTAFLASTVGVNTEVCFNKKIGAGLFGGEGFIMQKITGTGTVFVEVDGAAVEYDLEAGETMLVDTGSLAMMSSTCTLDIQSVKGVKNVLFGGEGLFLTKVTGPGHITLQTMPLSEFVNRITPYLPKTSSSSSVKFGD